MESVCEIYRIGHGPSASHTMGPRLAAERYRARYPDAHEYEVDLFGSLAATGKGHLTDQALEEVFEGRPFTIYWHPQQRLDFHPNAMRWYCVDKQGRRHNAWEIYSVGGGALAGPNEPGSQGPVYDLNTMADIMAWCQVHDASIAQYAFEVEGDSLRKHLANVWQAMQQALGEGLSTTGTLPGVLKVKRKARAYLERVQKMAPDSRRTGLLSAYALAVSEVNASGGQVSTAPTCGACGIVPAVLKYLSSTQHLSKEQIIDALAVAGIIGNLVKTNASISGADVGCQGEVGTACAMAAGAAAQIAGGSVQQIEYAAEMGIEHHLGLTCDPVMGMVQIPCIERNAVAAIRAVDCADLAMLGDGEHQISFDCVVDTMKRTGKDMGHSYKETSEAGLALLRVMPPTTPQ